MEETISISKCEASLRIRLLKENRLQQMAVCVTQAHDFASPPHDGFAFIDALIIIANFSD